MRDERDGRSIGEGDILEETTQILEKDEIGAKAVFFILFLKAVKDAAAEGCVVGTTATDVL